MKQPSRIISWIIALRLFALPASLIPYSFGAVSSILTNHQHLFQWKDFVIGLIAVTSIHLAGNLFNDICDHQLDQQQGIKPGSGALVRGWITLREAWTATLLFFVIAAVCGVYLILSHDILLLFLGILGVLGSILYSVPKYSLKRIGLGDITIFLSFGVLEVFVGWYLQTQSVHFAPVLWAIPLSLLVTAILHANNWRDVDYDSHASIKTLAYHLKEKGSYMYYAFLILVPYLSVTLLAILNFIEKSYTLPLSSLLVLLTLPQAFALLKKAKTYHTGKSHPVFQSLDAQTAQLNLTFGLCLILSILIPTMFS